MISALTSSLLTFPITIDRVEGEQTCHRMEKWNFGYPTNLPFSTRIHEGQSYYFTSSKLFHRPYHSSIGLS